MLFLVYSFGRLLPAVVLRNTKIKKVISKQKIQNFVMSTLCLTTIRSKRLIADSSKRVVSYKQGLGGLESKD